MVTIGRMSFWIHSSFEWATKKALEEFKKRGNVEKLKTLITAETMPSDKDLLEFLYNLIIHI